MIGIEFGQTACAAAWFSSSGPELIRDTDGIGIVPSAVALVEGRVLAGCEADAHLRAFPNSGLRDFRDRISDGTVHAIGHANMTAADCAALLFEHLAGRLRAKLGEELPPVAIAVPAYFNDTQRLAVKNAAVKAGLPVARLVNEPTAAALAYYYQHGKTRSTILVLTRCGADIDLTLLGLKADHFEILGIAGLQGAGGTTAAALLEKTLQQLRELLRLGKLKLEAVDGVLFAGDFSEWPDFSQQLELAAKIPVQHSAIPEEAIATGACIYAKMYCRDPVSTAQDTPSARAPAKSGCMVAWMAALAAVLLSMR